MGRYRKFKVDDVVELPRLIRRYATVVDYKHGSYGVIETDKLGRHPRGPVVYYKANSLQPLDYTSWRAARNRRANIRAGGDELRGCRCQCCAHVAGFDDE